MISCTQSVRAQTKPLTSTTFGLSDHTTIMLRPAYRPRVRAIRHTQKPDGFCVCLIFYVCLLFSEGLLQHLKQAATYTDTEEYTEHMSQNALMMSLTAKLSLSRSHGRQGRFTAQRHCRTSNNQSQPILWYRESKTTVE